MKYLLLTRWTGASEYVITAESKEEALAKFQDGEYDSFTDSDGLLYGNEDPAALYELDERGEAKQDNNLLSS